MCNESVTRNAIYSGLELTIYTSLHTINNFNFHYFVIIHSYSMLFYFIIEK
jgi:hypothetical protein